MNPLRWTALFGCALLLSGCASTRQSLPPLTGDPMIDGRNAIELGPTKDKVLWQYRTATVAMRRGQFDVAKEFLDDALARVEGSLGYDPTAKKSRGYFSAEAKKTFLGEPYERVMAYYYRGILYWMDGEPDNARACFRSGQIFDSDTEDKTYASDYVLLDYLDGFITTRLGGDGSDLIKRGRELARGLQPPPYNPKANVLIFVDYGPGPRKYATGEYAEELRFGGGQSPVRSARIKVESQTAALPPYDNLYFQATTRGGRVMDHVLGNKAVFKKSTDAVGTAAIVSGAILANNRNTQEVGAGLLAAGLLAKIISAATTPAADTRSWDNLPLNLSFAAMELPPGEHELTVEFQNESGVTLGNLTKKIEINIPPGAGDKVVYVSDQSQTPQSL